jgi:hypothetical protein
MGIREETVKEIQTALWTLPDEKLREVLGFIERLERSAESSAPPQPEPLSPLYGLHLTAISTGVPDLAKQHDHYLYGLDKRDA